MNLIDKNSLLGGLNISKGKLCVKEFYHKILGFLAVFRRRFRGIWGSTRGEGAFLTLRRGSSGRFEAPPDKPVPFHPRFATFAYDWR